MVRSAVSQGIGVTLGLQDKFSWAAVAAAGVGSAAGMAAGGLAGRASDAVIRGLGGTEFAAKVGNIVGGVVTGMADAVGNAGARSLIEGTDFGDNVRAALPSVLGNAIAGGFFQGDGQATAGTSGSGSFIDRLSDGLLDGAGNTFKGIGNTIAGATKATGDLLGFDGQFGYQGPSNLSRNFSAANIGQAFRGLFPLGSVNSGSSALDAARSIYPDAEYAESVAGSAEFTKIKDPKPNPLGTVGSFLFPPLDDPLNAESANGSLMRRMRAAGSGDDPIERGVAASGMSRDGLDTGLRVMLPTMQGVVFDEVAGALAGEGVGAVLGKAAGFAGRIFGKGRLPSGGRGTVPNLTDRGTLTNLFPGDPVLLQGRSMTLVQDGAGRYWLEGGGKRFTPSGRYDFVTMPNGTIRVARPNTSGEFSTHLGLSGGNEVSYAGSIGFTNSNSTSRGTVKFWSNDSGHYRPPVWLKNNTKLPPNLFRGR